MSYRSIETKTYFMPSKVFQKESYFKMLRYTFNLLISAQQVCKPCHFCFIYRRILTSINQRRRQVDQGKFWPIGQSEVHWTGKGGIYRGLLYRQEMAVVCPQSGTVKLVYAPVGSTPLRPFLATRTGSLFQTNRGSGSTGCNWNNNTTPMQDKTQILIKRVKFGN